MADMKQVRIEKITFNVGAGKDQNVLEKGMRLLKNITGLDPVKTITQKRIPSWGIRPGLPVGCKITIRDQAKIKDLITRTLKARDNKLKPSCFDDSGNVAYGVHEYIEMPGLEYDPKIGIMGFQLCITLEKPGYSVKRKSLNKKNVGKKHKITKDESLEFMKKEFNTIIED